MSRSRITQDRLQRFIEYFSARRVRKRTSTVEAELVSQAIIGHALAVDLRDCKVSLDYACNGLERILGLDVGDPDYKAKVQDYARSAYNEIDPELRT